MVHIFSRKYNYYHLISVYRAYVVFIFFQFSFSLLPLFAAIFLKILFIADFVLLLYLFSCEFLSKPINTFYLPFIIFLVWAGQISAIPLWFSLQNSGSEVIVP